VTTRAEKVARERDPLRRAALLLGPGFITGAADDDPSGIGTYAVAERPWDWRRSGRRAVLAFSFLGG
jgi:Mn2+/Fe2+ NRAMP family transporter